jgi:hypothetical protein
MNPLSHDTYMVFHPEHPDIVNASSSTATHPGLVLSRSPGHDVSSYRGLLQKVAALTYHNSRFRILFRGQCADYTVNHRGEPVARSSLYPSILRSTGEKERKAELNRRFALLARTEEKLRESLAARDVHRDRIVRWAIIQHYEIMATPLLDVTSSLQTALSFALAGNRDEGYIFALAFPQLTGLISVSIESLTQVIDLTQICPPDALRPHFQSGVLVGDYPTVDNTTSTHGGKGMVGNNFSCRLLSKFRLTDCRNWINEGFVPTRSDILFPDADDPWFTQVRILKEEVQAEATCAVVPSCSTG